MARNVMPLLIRRAKYDVDERQRELAALFTKEDKLLNEKKTKQDELAEAWQNLSHANDWRLQEAMPAFHQRQKIMIAELDLKLDNLAQEIAQAREKLNESYGEQKKLETIHESRQKELALQDAKKMGKEMDEIATQRAIRQKSVLS